MARCLLAATLALSSCVDSGARRPVGSRCESDAVCASGAICVYGRCREPCLVDRDCPSGQRCVAADGGLRACTLPDDCETDPCEEGQACVEGGTCVPVAGEGDADGGADVEWDGDVEACREPSGWLPRCLSAEPFPPYFFGDCYGDCNGFHVESQGGGESYCLTPWGATLPCDEPDVYDERCCSRMFQAGCCGL